MNEITPNEAWDTFVGEQSTAEFLACSETSDPEVAVREYADGHPFFVGLGEDEREEVFALLAEHIRRSSLGG